MPLQLIYVSRSVSLASSGFVQKSHIGRVTRDKSESIGCLFPAAFVLIVALVGLMRAVAAWLRLPPVACCCHCCCRRSRKPPATTTLFCKFVSCATATRLASSASRGSVRPQVGSQPSGSKQRALFPQTATASPNRSLRIDQHSSGDRSQICSNLDRWRQPPERAASAGKQ